MHSQVPFKIIMSYALIVSGFSFNFGVRFPPIFSSVISLFSFAISTSSRSRRWPITYHDQLLGYTIVPLVVFALLLALYKYLGKVDKIKHEFRYQVFNSFLLLTFLVLPTTSTKILNTFSCDWLDDGTRVLKSDMSIDCDSSKHKVFQVYAGAMIFVYPFGIPAMHFYLLYWYKAKGLLDRGQDKLVNTKMVKLVGF